MKSRRMVVSLIVAGVLSVLVGAVVWFAIWASAFLSHAEFALHATSLVTMAVEKYVQEHRKWPTSWKDLESVSVITGGRYSWPNELHEIDNIQDYVEVDFTLTLGEVARQRYEDFNAIRPKGPAFGGYRRYVPQLLETLRKVQRENRQG